jgi:hypothetical protein
MAMKRRFPFKWRLEGSFGPAPRMSSCNAVFSILTFYAALQSIIVIAEMEEAESIDSALSVEENEKQIVFESITISPIG